MVYIINQFILQTKLCFPPLHNKKLQTLCTKTTHKNALSAQKNAYTYLFNWRIISTIPHIQTPYNKTIDIPITYSIIYYFNNSANKKITKLNKKPIANATLIAFIPYLISSSLNNLGNKTPNKQSATITILSIKIRLLVFITFIFCVNTKVCKKLCLLYLVVR